MDVFVHEYLGSLWSDSVNLGHGWYWCEWFGYITLSSEPWVYHMQHGFLYAFGDSPGSIVFWDDTMGAFWWTSDAMYPYLYRFTDGKWLWYQKESSDPRWFVRLADGVWEQW